MLSNLIFLVIILNHQKSLFKFVLNINLIINILWILKLVLLVYVIYRKTLFQFT